jgi:hypothetical protein
MSSTWHLETVGESIGVRAEARVGESIAAPDPDA